MPPPTYRDGRLRQVLRQDDLARRRLERGHAAEHLVEDDAERIDVRLLGHRSPTDLLGREVLRRRLCGEDALRRRRVAQAGELHVHQLDAPVLEHHHVAGPERAVDGPHVVKRLHGCAQVEHEAQRGVDVERAAPRQRLAQAAPLDKFHGHEDPAVLRFTKLQHADQTRMTRRGRDDRPAPALDRLCRMGCGG